MLTRREANAGLIGAAMLAAAPSAIAAETERALPPPRLDGGKPLMQALRARRSTREFAGRALPAEVLSDLLWDPCRVRGRDRPVQRRDRRERGRRRCRARGGGCPRAG